MEISVIEHDGGAVEVWTIEGEARRNTLSRALVAELGDRVAAAAGRRGLRAVVLTGAGTKAFCAGADLKERLEMSEDDVRSFLGHLRRTLESMERSPVIFVAAVNGAAFGGGTELALACDIRAIAAGAEMALTETRLAIIPGGGGTQRLPRAVGLSLARDLILTGRRVGAEEAVRIGLCTRLAPEGGALAAALDVAREVAAGGPLALAAAKQALLEGEGLPLARGLDVEASCYELTLVTKDRLEGLAAFREKRRPVYRGE